MSNKIVDLTFGISSQAMAVMNFIKDLTPEFANYHEGYFTDVSFKTLPWYNGREKGIVITMSVYYRQNIHIAFFEHRNSDAIHCLKWFTDEPYFNHPLEDMNIFENAYHSDSKWDTAISFKYGQIRECADWIYNEFETFYTESKETEEHGQRN